MDEGKAEEKPVIVTRKMLLINKQQIKNYIRAQGMAAGDGIADALNRAMLVTLTAAMAHAKEKCKRKTVKAEDVFSVFEE